MSLFDYDILNGKCSKYETNHLHMYVDDDIDLGNLSNMSLSSYATFVHEYIHYIQHVTSLYGIRMSDMYNRVFSRYRDYIRNNEVIDIPLRLWDTDEDIHQFVIHFNKIEGDKTTGFNISDIEIDKREISIAEKEKTAVWIGCYDFDNDKADEHGFLFGHRCVVEGMAHAIQSIINNEIKHNIIPYHAVELIIGKIIPDIVQDKKKVASICLCALLWDNPGIGFFQVLELIKSHPNWDGKELYKSIVQDYAVSYNGQEMPFYRLLQRFSNDLKESFKALLERDLEYYSLVIDNCIIDCGKCHHRLIDFLYDYDICDRESFREQILNHYGYPFIDGRNQSALPLKTENGTQSAYKETAILYGIELIMARLLRADNKKECKRYPICSSTMFIEGAKCDATEECLSSQWKKKESCVFTEALKYFWIKDKEYVDT